MLTEIETYKTIIMRKHLLLLFLSAVLSCAHCVAQVQNGNDTFEGYEITPQGAWCWFADPRALHHESKDGRINKTYIGYIDTHGNIKAMQIDRNTNRTDEVLVRSWFQPDDHNNPTFLVLPDERVMIFYSRHTDDPCFYYRVTREPGDITTLGEEKIIKTRNNTTYPSPFILSDDPNHIYLCWRGIGWHPTIGRLLIPDAAGNTGFDWGPYQIVQSTGARPYAKYTSNGKDKIYLAYTTGHPDNEQPNYIYFNEIDIKSLTLRDINGKVLSVIQDAPHRVNKKPEYIAAYPDAVVEHSDYRNWLWEVALDSSGKPCIAMVRISPDKKNHDYYYVQWTGKEWKKTFLAHGGGHFHQTPDTERCYSGGMAIDKKNDGQIYASVPMEGLYGSVYEIVKYIVHEDGSVDSEPITRNSHKNNSRPYFISGAENEPLYLTWMYGDYYDWIVSSKRPKAYCTAIHSIEPLFEDGLALSYEPIKQGLLKKSGIKKLSVNLPDEFTISLMLENNGATFKGTEWNFGNFSFGIDSRTAKPFLMVDQSFYGSSNVLGSSDAWKRYGRATDGKWLEPEMPDTLHLYITYSGGKLRTYINGLMDQSVTVEKVVVSKLESNCPEGISGKYRVYDRLLSQTEIKRLE